MGRSPWFAPTDDAFAALPAGTLESLLKPENKEQLVAILTYHVVPGAVMAKDVVGLSEASTVQGTSITVTTNDSGVMVNGARVVTTDIEASNGVNPRDRQSYSAAVLKLISSAKLNWASILPARFFVCAIGAN